MKIAVIDYKAGNLRNVQKAVERLGQSAYVVSSGSELSGMDGIILPGVGAFGQGMENLNAAGFVEAIRREVLEKGRPLLGICLGMHLLGETGYEGGAIQGLNLLPMTVPRFNTVDCGVRLPHIGWNNLDVVPGSRLFDGLPQGGDFYFVHSYHVVCEDDSFVSARCDYCYSFVAAVERENIFGTQFHPEKSQRYGLRVMENFLSFCEAKV
jgi:imidazole glycerol-phosphate synthase subunit HisH